MKSAFLLVLFVFSAGIVTAQTNAVMLSGTIKEIFPGIRPQYPATPKLNPSISLNYRNNKVNLFLQGDNLYTQTLNKNEFTDRYYDTGQVIRQQLKRNRNTTIITGKAGLDWYANANNTISVSGLFSSEKIIDRGDEPFFTGDLSERLRLWRFPEDDLQYRVNPNHNTYQSDGYRYSQPFPNVRLT